MRQTISDVLNNIGGSNFDKLLNEPLNWYEDSIYSMWLKDFKKEKFKNIFGCSIGLLFLFCMLYMLVTWEADSGYWLAIAICSLFIYLFIVGILQEIKFVRNFKKSQAKIMHGVVSNSYFLIRQRYSENGHEGDKQYRVDIICDENNLEVSNIKILKKHNRRIPIDSRVLIVAIDENNIYAVPLHLYEY